MPIWLIVVLSSLGYLVAIGFAVALAEKFGNPDKDEIWPVVMGVLWPLWIVIGAVAGAVIIVAGVVWLPYRGASAVIDNPHVQPLVGADTSQETPALPKRG